MPDIFDGDKLIIFLAFLIPGFLGMQTYSLFVATTERDFVKQLPTAIAYSTLHYALTLWIVIVAPHGTPQIVAAYLDVFILPLLWAPLLLIIRGGRRYDDIFSPRIRAMMLRPEATPWERLFGENLQHERWIRITSKSNEKRTLGGILAAGSYISRYPADRMLFISQEWTFNDDGSFAEPAHGGILVTITDDDIVEVLESDHVKPRNDGNQHDG